MATTVIPNKVTIRQVRRRPRSLESYFWLFMRLSGVALLLLAVGHMVMQHIQNDVHDASLEWVLNSRWSLVWIRVWDFLLLGLAFVHGLNGFHTVMVDYVHNPSAVKIIRLLIIVIGGIILMMGGVAIIGAPMPVR
jgi:succinate dehydrogenase / fumarate reductase, membrane anchor subunit